MIIVRSFFKMCTDFMFVLYRLQNRYSIIEATALHRAAA